MIIDNRLYRQDLEWVSDYIDFSDGARILITGATGLIGSFLMDAMIARRRSGGAALILTGTSRHLENLQKRFGYAGQTDWLRFIERAPQLCPVSGRDHYHQHDRNAQRAQLCPQASRLPGPVHLHF